VNQGTSTLTVTANALILRGTGSGSSENVVARVKSAPSTPYVITAFILGNLLTKSFLSYGLLFRESGTGELVILRVVGVGGAGGVQLNVDKLNSPTSYSAAYDTFNAMGPIYWFRIADNGTNRICSISSDGQTWLDVHSVGRTDFLTADQVGFFVETVNQATPNFDSFASVLSWNES
jgi:hypothetical protein